MDIIAKSLKLKTLDEWNNISHKVIKNNGADKTILKYGGIYKGSICFETYQKALCAAYPNRMWYPWRFPDPKVPSDYWKSKGN